MKLISTLFLSVAFGSGAVAQTTISNGDFELWGGNPSPGVSAEPNGWYSNKSGSTIAKLGPQTCFQETGIIHGGTSSVKVVTENYIGTKVNGVATTAVVNAVSTDKSLGYIGTINRDNTSDVRRRAFTGTPDSLVGWYQYVAGAATEQGKVRAILHTGDYYDPETPVSGNHPDLSANKIADALFLTPMSSVSTWTRFSVPFNYISFATPSYIMINITSSADQVTTVGGSTLYVDDLQVVYAAPPSCGDVTGLVASAVTATTATISWTAVSGSVGYFYAVDNSATAPATGTFTSATSIPVSSLTASTLYFAHVLDTCAGAASAWVTTPFTTSASTTGFNNKATGPFVITAFPNPVNEVLMINIEGRSGIAGQVQLMDISGRTISTTIADANTVSIDMSGLSSGIYFARYTDSEHTQTIKINKQ